MTKIKVDTNPCYDIVLKKDYYSLVSELAKVINSEKILIVTDSNVAPLYLNKVTNMLREHYLVETFTLKAGEISKNIDCFMAIINAMERFTLSRADTVIALGGGVVGDITGFAAATYLRGINFVQLPTTLLADIDSSIGGKTGINLGSGKNLLGAFYQPMLVYINLDTLSSLSELEFKNGIGEGIKYGMLSSDVFDLLQSGLNSDNLHGFIEQCIMIKKQIVEKDCHEKGERRLLNLGHTFGHAIEKLSNYKVPHGIAVTKGLIIALRVSRSLGFSDNELNKVIKMCQSYNIDISVDFSLEEMAEIIKSDKKIENSKVNFVFVQSIGKCIVKKINIGELIKLCK